MAFKPDIDDTRDSLSLDLYNYFKKKKLKTFVSDDYVNIKNKINKSVLIKNSDIIILGTPHKIYKKIRIPKKKYLIDTWGFFEK